MTLSNRPVDGEQFREIRRLRSQLSEAKETLLAIRKGDVDAVVVSGKRGLKVFTLEGAEHAYRLLIESIYEGALTLSVEGIILYSNPSFAAMVGKTPVQTLGKSFDSFVSVSDRAALTTILNRKKRIGTKILVQLKLEKGMNLPVQISIRPLAKNGFDREIITLVVTDLTEARKNEARLRALAQKIVEVQEEERKRVAQELHDGITQMLCGVLFHSQALLTKTAKKELPTKVSLRKLCAMVSDTIEEVSRISHHLRPSVLDHLGFVASLKETCREFKNRTAIAIEIQCQPMKSRLSADVELACYRILQESLRNIEKHSHAKKVKVRFSRSDTFLELSIHDNGVGFNPKSIGGNHGKYSGLGVLGMRERMATLGGSLEIISGKSIGTTLVAHVAQMAGDTLGMQSN